jgi:TIR domain
MSSLAELPALVGFFSYSREDDEGSGGRLSKLRDRIQEELRLQLGRTKNDFRLWQDKVAIAHGELWENTIKKGISESVFFIPIITPTAVRSSYCKFEFDSFLAREKELDRNNLIFPILYVPVPALKDERWRQDTLLSIVGSRQYEDWQNLRHLDASSSEVVALRVQTFCANICRALEQPWLSPEERQQAEARRIAEDERRRQQEAEIKQRANEEERRRKAEAEERRRDEEERRRDEEERRRQEAEDRRRLDEAEAKKRRRDEEWRGLEIEGKLDAKEAQPRTQSEQEPQQPVKPWLLPLIGAIVAAVPMLLFVARVDAYPIHG